MAFDYRRYLESLKRFGEKPGLERIRRILAHLGDPQRSYPVVHVGGTNGKGSVVAMTASVLSAAGYEVVSSPALAFGDSGYGGWSCPAGKVVLGGGFAGTDPVSVSAPGTPGSVWPHYTFGANEYGWVVQDDQNSAGNTSTAAVA